MTKKYIKFSFLEKKPKTVVYAVVNIKYGNTLGIIKWHPAWRKYCFFAEGNTIYDVGCLDDIKNFIQNLMDKRKLGDIINDSLINATEIFKER